MNIEKIFDYKKKLQHDLSFKEISKLYCECLFKEYEKLKAEDSDAIHCYLLTIDVIHIFTQMVSGTKFEESYLKDKIKW